MEEQKSLADLTLERERLNEIPDGWREVDGPEGVRVFRRLTVEADRDPKPYRDNRPLRWRVWWRLGFSPIIRLVSMLPIAEWRQEQWIAAVDIWAMDHIGRQTEEAHRGG